MYHHRIIVLQGLLTIFWYISPHKLILSIFKRLMQNDLSKRLTKRSSTSTSSNGNFNTHSHQTGTWTGTWIVKNYSIELPYIHVYKQCNRCKNLLQASEHVSGVCPAAAGRAMDRQAADLGVAYPRPIDKRAAGRRANILCCFREWFFKSVK